MEKASQYTDVLPFERESEALIQFAMMLTENGIAFPAGVLCQRVASYTCIDEDDSLTYIPRCSLTSIMFRNCLYGKLS